MPDASRPRSAPLTRALPDVAAWTRQFADSDIPVLRDTADALEGLRAIEDDIDANLLGEMIAPDPLMTLKLMAHAARHRSARQVTDPQTVTAAIVMMGITPFFRTFGPQPAVEDLFAHEPFAMDGFNQVLRRGRRAAQFALSFAVHRMDANTSVVHQAALLHDFAELLLWVHAPALAVAIQGEQQADPALGSADAQRRVLNIEVGDLQQSLMKTWRLSEMLTRITDDRHADHPSVRTVRLAIRVARHTAHGWSHPALPDDMIELSDLLQLSPSATMTLLHDIES